MALSLEYNAQGRKNYASQNANTKYRITGYTITADLKLTGKNTTATINVIIGFTDWGSDDVEIFRQSSWQIKSTSSVNGTNSITKSGVSYRSKKNRAIFCKVASPNNIASGTITFNVTYETISRPSVVTAGNPIKYTDIAPLEKWANSNVVTVDAAGEIIYFSKVVTQYQSPATGGSPITANWYNAQISKADSTA